MLLLYRLFHACRGMARSSRRCPRPNRSETNMKTVAEVVELTPAKDGGSRRPWELVLAADEIQVRNSRGKLAMTIDRDEANRRILFPSFWLSVKHIQIFEEGQVAFEFLPDKEVMQRIQAYLDVALRQDPSARRKLKQSGVA